MSLYAWAYDDGGRAGAGYKGKVGDCVARALTIANGEDYQVVYAELNWLAKNERAPKRGKPSSARNGMHKKTYREWLRNRGWIWTPTMAIGQGCTVHLRADELPAVSPLIAEVSKHVVAVVDGAIHDTHDPSRNGTRCVYGYWTLQP